MTRLVYWTLMILAVALFIASMFLDVVRGYPGYWALGLGWLLLPGVLSNGPTALAWLANPAFALACIFSARGQNRDAVISAISAIGLGLCFALGGSLRVGDANFTSDQRGAAYPYWMLSFLLVLTAAYWRKRVLKHPKTDGAFD